MARPIQTPVARQKSGLHKEVNLPESKKLLRELSVLRQDVLREVRQDKAEITRKLQEIQEDRLVCEVSDVPVMCITVALIGIAGTKKPFLNLSLSLFLSLTHTPSANNHQYLFQWHSSL